MTIITFDNFRAVRPAGTRAWTLEQKSTDAAGGVRWDTVIRVDDYSGPMSERLLALLLVASLKPGGVEVLAGASAARRQEAA
jgi:hypothetical protein